MSGIHPALYEYDELGRPTVINQDPDGPGWLLATLAAGYPYDALSRRTRLTNGNGTLTDYTWSLDDNLLSIAHQWTGQTATFTYTYDQTGLQTGYASTDDRFAPLFTTLGTITNVPNTLNQYTTAAGLSLTYDQNGNLTGDGTHTYTYDANNHFLSETAGEVTFTYDPLGRRDAKAVGSSTTNYLYDGDEVIAEYDGQGLLSRKFIMGPGIDSPVTMVSGGQDYYYHANHLGSIIGISDSAGSLTEEYRYTTYGEVDNVGVIENSYLYTGRRLDPETGLYYYRARYYDAGLRRFLQADPIGYAGGMNLYGYVGNSPVNFSDPLGLWTVVIGGSWSLQFVAAGGEDVGYAIGYSWKEGITHGPIASLSVGIGSPSGFVGGFVQVTNANSVDDLKGFSVQGGGSVNVGASIGADYVAGLDESPLLIYGKPPELTYQGIQLSIGGGFSPFIAEAHALLSGSIGHAFGKEVVSCTAN